MPTPPRSYVFHYMVEDGITYLCLADEQQKRRIPFLFLQDVKEKFCAQYGDRIKTAISFAMNTEFARVRVRWRSLAERGERFGLEHPHRRRQASRSGMHRCTHDCGLGVLGMGDVLTCSLGYDVLLRLLLGTQCARSTHTPPLLQVLSERMEFFNENPAADNFGKVRGQLAEVKDIMVENIGA